MYVYQLPYNIEQLENRRLSHENNTLENDNSHLPEYKNHV